MLVQVVLSVDVWIWNDLPYAVSQFRVTWQMLCELPRSTSTHCGSLAALDQRVPVLPSTAADAGVPAFSMDDATTGWFCDSSVPAAEAGPERPATSAPAASTTAAAAEMNRRFLLRRDLEVGTDDMLLSLEG